MSPNYVGKLKGICRDLWRQRYAVLPLRESVESLNSWFSSAIGRALLQEQQKALKEILPCLFGYHLLQLSVTPRSNLAAESMINHQVNLAPVVLGGAGLETVLPNRCISAVTDFEQLPFASESIDLAILHHTLDFSSRPHQLLREVSKTIIPHGYVIVVGFNPFSLFGLLKPFGRLFCLNPIWRRHSLRKGRVIDWLRLLDFEVCETYQGFFRAPVNYAAGLRYLEPMERIGRRWRWPFGGFYVLVARKDVVGMTPINPDWRAVTAPSLLPSATGASRFRARNS